MRCGVTLKKIADPDTFMSNPGDPIKILYTPVWKDGDIVLNESGKINIPEMINSYAETTDMSFILARLMAGDDSVLFARQGFYGDVSMLTQNHQDMLNQVLDSRVYFDHLPDDIRAKFDNSFVNWIAAAGSEDWVSKMVRKSGAPVIEPEKKEENLNEQKQ